MIDPKVILLVHDQNAMEALNAYLDSRINDLKESLTMAEGDQVIRLQSAIQELRKMKKLKDVVLSKSD